MFEKYLAQKEDLEAVEEALGYIWHPKMNFVFRDKIKISDTVVVSYDSKFIYLWSKKRLGSLTFSKSEVIDYFLHKIPHNLKMKDEWQHGWWGNLWIKEIDDLLPDNLRRISKFVIPRINGGLLTPFVELQKKRNSEPSWPYTTRESFLATIAHEFGHVYWDGYKLWWPSNKAENIRLLTIAHKLYSQRNITATEIPLYLPMQGAVGEIFAFCTEYYASNIFWKVHKKNLDKSTKKRLESLIEEEQQKDLERQDSVISDNRFPHDFASVYGKILLSRYPDSWPHILISSRPQLT